MKKLSHWIALGLFAVLLTGISVSAATLLKPSQVGTGVSTSTSKGVLLVGTSTGAFVPLSPGATGTVLTASSTAPNGISWETAAAGGGLQAANNLSELTNTSTARTNLGAADRTVSNLTSTSSARTNLGLTDTAVVASSSFLKTANNLSELTSTSSARATLGIGFFASSTISVDSSAGATTSVATASSTIVNLKTKVWDFLGEFTTSSNVFTARNTGYYLAIASIHYATTSANFDYTCAIYNASTTGVLANTYSQFPANGHQSTVQCFGMGLINAGNTIQLITSQNSGVNQMVDGVRQTKLEIIRLF